MRGALLRIGLSVWILALVTPECARAQKSDLENELKNIPKDAGSLKESAPPPATTVPNNSGSGRRRVNPSGTYVNRFTGVGFPKRVGEYSRQEVEIFDSEGRATDANYVRKVSGALIGIITAYSYPIPASLASGGAPRVFDDEKLAIANGQKNARLVREEPYRAPDGSIGDFAEYEFVVGKGAGTSVYSRLYLFESKGWLLKFRATYPKSRAREGSAEIESFLRAFGATVLRNQVNT